MLCAALLPPGANRLLADQNDRTHQIGSKLKCMCNGCDQAAGKCYHVGGAYSGPCDTAKNMLKEIDTHIASGIERSAGLGRDDQGVRTAGVCRASEERIWTSGVADADSVFTRRDWRWWSW